MLVLAVEAVEAELARLAVTAAVGTGLVVGSAGRPRLHVVAADGPVALRQFELAEYFGFVVDSSGLFDLGCCFRLDLELVLDYALPSVGLP